MAARVTLCCLALSLGSADVAQAQEKAPAPGLSYGSLQDLPDWSGWWGYPIPPPDEYREHPLPMKPADLARIAEARAKDSDPDPGRYCHPPHFVGYSGGFVESVEFLFTPGRITLTTEMGLIRRIYTDGRPVTQDVEPTNTGTSVGHWEGKTLVVETVGILPTSPYPSRIAGAVPMGNNVRITERISLTAEKNLQFEIVTIAPDILVAPDKRTRVYTPVAKRAATEVSFCAEHDRSIDPVTGKQRFDMTPPADMPPPPPD